jgi:hypothetical protein
MTSADRILASLLCCTATAMITGGCEDADARRRAETQAIITAAGEELRGTAVAGLDSAQEAQQRQMLNRVIADLDGTRGGEPAQQSAALRLAAGAHRQLAALALTRAERIEADHRSRRTILHGKIDAIVRLDTLASSLEDLSTDAEQAQLTRDRQNAEEQLREHSQQLAALDAPIADLTAKNGEDAIEAERLRKEANRLRREGADRGPTAGFTAYERGVQLDRSADRIEYEIGQRETELRFSLLPRQAVAQTRVEHLQMRIAAIDDAKASLAALSEATAEEARLTRQLATEFREAIDAEVSALGQSKGGPLREQYEQTASELQRAATKARKAASQIRGELADPARLEAARTYQELGALHSSVGQGLAEHIGLLQRLAAVSTTWSSLGPEAADLAVEHKRQIEQATAAYTTAREVLDQVSGRTAGRKLEMLKNNLDMAISALSGQAIHRSSLMPPAGAGSPPGPPTTAAPDHGRFATPDDLLTHLEALASTATVDVDELLRLYHAETPEGRAMTALVGDLVIATGRLREALVGRFGPSAVEAASGALALNAGLPTGLAGRITERTDDRATITFNAPTGASDTMSLVRVGGSWLIDADDIDEADRQRLSILQAMAPTVKTACGDLVERLEAGEFSTPDEVIQALVEAMVGPTPSQP